MKLILSLIKAGSLGALVYFSTAVAFMVHVGGDVEYYIALFAMLAAVIYAVVDAKD